MADTFNIEIAYANAQQQVVITILVLPNCTVAEAIHQSGILERFPEINLTVNKIGIFSKAAALDTIVHVGDRIEIYRPLLVDPKQARKQRARRQIKE